MNPHSFSRNYQPDTNYGRPTASSGRDPWNDDRHHDSRYAPPSNGGRNPAAQVFPSGGPTGKRGSRACVSCRKGKNRCEGDPTGSNQSCRRCLLNGIPCVFEKASDRRERPRNDGNNSETWSSGDAEGRVASLEKSVQELANGQSQIQSALQQILSMLPQGGLQGGLPQGGTGRKLSTPGSVSAFMPSSEGSGVTPVQNMFPSTTSPPQVFTSTSPAVTHSSAQGLVFSTSVEGSRCPQDGERQHGEHNGDGAAKQWPKLPGFAPPNHRFGTYGIIPVSSAPPSPSHSRRSSRSSSTHSTSSDAAVPSSSMVAPIQALQTLANAADQAAAFANGGSLPADDASSRQANDSGGEESRGRSRKRKRVTIGGNTIHLRVKKQTKPDPTPRNPFPDVLTKGLVSEAEVRELWEIFFTGCHYFVPLWDKSYDIFESYIERTPFSTNGLLAVAAKIRAGNGPLGETFHRCLEEAQGIARSTLFGPIVRKEAVMAMLILSVWSQYSWLPCGHALRMGLDMNLHRALDNLADTTSDEERSEAEERDLVVSARIWLNCWLHEHLSSLGTGKPLLLRDDSSVRAARVLLTHPMVSETDASLVARVELVKIRIRVLEHLEPLHGKVNSSTMSFVHKIFAELQKWYNEWHSILRTQYDEESVLVRLLEVDLLYAQLWTVCVALRGCQWDKLPHEQRELAFLAKDAAMKCVQIFLGASNFRRHLKYATHDQLATIAFAAVFLLKIAMLYPSAISLPTLNSKVSEVAHVLSAECFAERYALTLRLMLSNFRRKTGATSTVPGTPRGGHLASETLPTNPSAGPEAIGQFDGGLQSLLSLPQIGEGLGEGVNSETWPLFADGADGFAWPNEFSPSNLPSWLQDNSFADLGLPVDGSDSLFLPLELANMFLPSGTASSATYNFSLPDSGEVGAEAW